MLRCSLRIFFGFVWRITTFMWWICTGKNPLHSSRVQERLQIVLFMLSFREVIFVSADSRIASGRNQKFVSLLLISSSSRPNLLSWFWSQPITTHDTYILEWMSPGLIIEYDRCHPCWLPLPFDSLCQPIVDRTRSSATSKNVRLKNWIASSGSSCMSNTFHGAFSRSSWKACSLKFSHLRYLMVFSMFWIDLFRYFVTMPTGRWSDIPILSTLVIRICWGRSMYTWSKQVLLAGRAISLISWFSPRLEVYLRRRWLTWSSFNAFMFMSPKSSIFLSVLYLIEGFLQLLVHIRRRF